MSAASTLTTLGSVVGRIADHPLNRRQRARAVLRFASWQVKARLARRALIFDWVGGSKLQASLGDTGVTGNLYNGLQEPAEMAFLLHLLRPDDFFVDVGANAGCYTVLASRVVGCRTVAFEPVPSAYERLQANVRLNRISTLADARNRGLGAEVGSLRFSQHRDVTNHVLAEGEEDPDALVVDVGRLDDELETAPTLIKVDVEGFERAVVEGGTELLRNEQVTAVVLELNQSGERYGFRDEDTVALMAELGFVPTTYEPERRKMIALEGKNLASGNTIFVRDIDAVQQRVARGRSFEINGVVL